MEIKVSFGDNEMEIGSIAELPNMLLTNAAITATDLYPLPTPPVFTVGWFTKTEIQIKKCQNTFFFYLSFSIIAIQSSSRSLQLSWFRLPTVGTNTQRNRHGHCDFLTKLD